MSAQSHNNPITPPPAAAPEAPGTVFVMGDHPVVNAGLARLIKSAPDLALCGMGRSTRPFLEEINALRPKLVLLDLTPTLQGFLDLFRELRSQSPTSRILILCDKADVLEASRAVTLGASGIILKHQDTEAFLKAIRGILSSSPTGARPRRFSPAGLGGGAPSQSPDCLDALTEREREVFRLTGVGKTAAEIAQDLGLSIKTVASHRSKIKEKLGLESSTELIRRAMQLRRLDSADPAAAGAESCGI